MPCFIASLLNIDVYIYDGRYNLDENRSIIHGNESSIRLIYSGTHYDATTPVKPHDVICFSFFLWLN